MLIEKIRKELTREEFKKCFKDDEMGIHFEHNNLTYTCPEDLKLEDIENCKSEAWNCEQCWLNAIKNIKFKGEE